jgi:hypothetical protein
LSTIYLLSASSQVKSKFTLSQETHNILPVRRCLFFLIFDLMVMMYMHCYIGEGLLLLPIPHDIQIVGLLLGNAENSGIVCFPVGSQPHILTSKCVQNKAKPPFVVEDLDPRILEIKLTILVY